MEILAFIKPSTVSLMLVEDMADYYHIWFFEFLTENDCALEISNFYPCWTLKQ